MQTIHTAELVHIHPHKVVISNPRIHVHDHACSNWPRQDKRVRIRTGMPQRSISTPLQREVFTASQPHCRGIDSISTTSTSHKSSISTTSTSPKSSISTTSASPKSSISTTSTSQASQPQAQVTSQAYQPGTHKHKSQVKHLDPYPIAEVHQHKSQVKEPHPIAEGGIHTGTRQEHAGDARSGTQVHTRPLPSLPTQLNFLRSKSLHHYRHSACFQAN